MAITGVAAMALAAGIILAAEVGGTTPPTTPPAKAAGVGHPGPDGGLWAEKLGLTPDQRGQIAAIMKDAREQAKAAADPAAKKAAFTAAFEKVKTTVLTENQRKKIEELRAAPGFSAHARMHRAANFLGLTPDQRAAAKAIFKAAHEAAVKVTDRAAKVKIFADAKEKVRTTVLTDVQRQKLAALREKIKDRWQHKAPAAAAPATPKVPAAPTAAPAFPGAATAPIRI
jgi:Spy/CpxP family protein refolding chaperone